MSKLANIVCGTCHHYVLTVLHCTYQLTFYNPFLPPQNDGDGITIVLFVMIERVYESSTFQEKGLSGQWVFSFLIVF